MSQATPDSWEPLRARVATLLAHRNAVLDETAAAWAGFAREAGWTRGDVEALWDGLTEDLVRRYGKTGADTTRADVLAAMAALRERVLRRLPA